MLDFGAGPHRVRAHRVASSRLGDGATWTSQPGPRAIAWSAVTYDAARQKLVVFGGYGGSALDETWEY